MIIEYSSTDRTASYTDDDATVTIDMTDPSGRAYLRSIAGDVDEIVSRDMSVYQTGWARATWGIHPDSLQEYAESMENQPHYLGHNPRQLLGRTGAGRVEILEDGRQRLVQDLHYTTELGLSTVIHGGDLRASIGATTTPRSELICSVCGKRWLEGDCDHWVGDVSDDGSPWMVLITHPIARETSTTHSPASDGTGSDAISRAELALEAPLALQTLPPWAVEYMREHLAARADAQTLQLADIVSEHTSTIAELSSRLAEITQERDAHAAAREAAEQAEALRVVRDARRRKALRTPPGMEAHAYEAELASMYRTSRRQWDLMLSSIPDSTITVVESASSSDPTPASPRPRVGTGEYYSWLATEARRISTMTGEDPSVVARRLRQE